jgi:cysteine desulfurase/selenocysteine lyase
MLVFFIFLFTTASFHYSSCFRPVQLAGLNVRRKNSFLRASIESIHRHDFPILDTYPYPEKRLIYLDSAASSQKPVEVISAMNEYYLNSHANVHRAAHSLAAQATALYENARREVQLFVHAKIPEEIVFTHGATESINIVALSHEKYLKPDDEIILSVMEHHSNLVPWQMLAQKTGAKLKFVQLTSDMEFDLNHYQSVLSKKKTRLVAVSFASNVLGVVNPVKQIIELAKSYGATVLLDACQALPHLSIDVQKLDVDFLVGSAHKMCGPTGIGFLYGKLNKLELLPPVFGGGEMINTVDLMSSTYAPPPARFEAGTPPIAEAIGFAAAIKYLKEKVGMENITKHSRSIGTYLLAELMKIPGIDVYGPNRSTENRSGLVSFNCRGIHPTDLAFFLDKEGIAVRSGHHCAQPLHKEILQVAGSLRVSPYFYNNQEDIDEFLIKLEDKIRLLKNFK